MEVDKPPVRLLEKAAPIASPSAKLCKASPIKIVHTEGCILSV